MASTLTAQEHWAMKGDVKLFAFRKFKDKPANLSLIHI